MSLGRVAAALRDAERDGRGDDAERHAIALRGREHVAAEGLRYRQRKLQRERDDALLETWAARHDVKLRERESSHRRGPAPDQRPGKGGGMAR